MSSYFDKYSKLDLLQNGKKPDIESIRAQVVQAFNGADIKSKIVSFSDADPLRFALKFLYLIDQHAIPMPMGSGEIQISEPSQAPTDPYYICLSSGTTGEPKPIHLNFEKALQNAKAHAEGFGISHEDTIVKSLPIYHSFGIIAYILTPLVTESAVDFRQGIVGLRSFNSPGRHTLHVSPSQARFILKDKFHKPEGLTKLTIGAGALNSQELLALHEKLPAVEIYVSYGLTEAGPRVTAGLYNKKLKLFSNGWIGQALPGIELGILRDDNVLPEGKGTLCVKSPTLSTNLSSNEMTGDWLLTRDQVSIYGGQVYFISRDDDIIKCGGITLYPAVIENQFRHISGVEEVVVLKKADPVYDEVPVLFVEGKASRTEIESFISNNIDPAIAPREIVILEKLPRMSLNKVDRSSLKKMIGTSNL